jgi:hypothetical protein
MSILGRVKNRKDGWEIVVTIDCPGCNKTVIHPDNDRLVCLWGKAWKYIIDTDKPISCMKVRL